MCLHKNIVKIDFLSQEVPKLEIVPVENNVVKCFNNVNFSETGFF